MINFQEPVLLSLLLLALLSGISIWIYRRTIPSLSVAARTVLLTLRLAALLFLIAVLVRPLFSLTYSSQLPPQIVVLVDNSASMQLMEKDQSRSEIADSILQERIWDQLKKKAEMQFRFFSDSLTEGNSLPEVSQAGGKSTSLSTPLLKLTKLNPELSAAVIITDGGHNLGPDPAAVASQLDFPVFTIGIGREEIPNDLAINSVESPEEIYLGAPAGIEVLVSGTGKASRKVTLTMKEDSRVLQEKEITIFGGGQRQKVKMELTPHNEGLHRYQVFLPNLEGEITYQNNHRKFSLRVQKTRLKVFCLAGNLTWDYRFLKRFLESQPNLEKSYAVFDGNKLLEGKYPGQAELNNLDLLIIVDPGQGLLAGKEAWLEDFVVKQGKATLFLLDNHFLSSSSNLKLSILPFDNPRLGINYNQFNWMLSEPAETNPVLRLSENREENSRMWESLPPFQGILLASSHKPQAGALALQQIGKESPPRPALISQEFGRGKVLTSLAFPFWRWEFLLTGLGQNDQAYSRFLGNAIRWLTSEKRRQNLELATDKPVYQAGEKIELGAAYYDEAGGKISGGEMKIKLRNISSKREREFTLTSDENQDYTTTINYLEPGDYSAQAAYYADKKILAQARTEFQVEEYSLEDQTLTMNRQLLTQMAEVSGGKFYTKDDFQNLSQDLMLQKKVVEKQISFEIWNQPLILILAVGFLGLEWYLRKRHQLP